METPPSNPPRITAKALRNMGFAAPDWMGIAQKKLFRTIVSQRLAAQKPPTAAELDRIADYFAARYRIDTLRDLLHEDEGRWMRGDKMNDLKARILQTTRQMDAAEKQSHALAQDLGLI